MADTKVTVNGTSVVKPTVNTDIEKRYLDVGTTQGIETGYDISTYGAENGGDYVSISVGRYIKAVDSDGIRIGSGYRINHSDVLDPTNKNTYVGTAAASPLTVSVPIVSVPEETKALTSQIEYDADGNLVTPTAEDIAKEIRTQADSLTNIPEYTSPDYLSQDSLDATPSTLVQPEDLTKYSQLNTNASSDLVTQENTPCRLESEIPDLDSLVHSDDEDDMLKKLKDLLDTDVDNYEDPDEVHVSKLTERAADGQGVFDFMASSLVNHLKHGLDVGLIEQSDIRAIYTEALQQTIETSANFTLQKDQAYWNNLLIKNQMIQANMQALLTKAQLIMLPLELKLKLRQLDILEYQVIQEKWKVPNLIAQYDATREQTALTCQQRKLAMEQLAQAEFDRKLKQEQVTQAQLQSQITAESVTQSKQQTKQLVAQVEQTVEQSKLINAQARNALKDLKVKDAQLIQMKAQLKLQAQQLLREREQTALIKAQVASQYANITALQESIRVAKAQYSDTIDGVEVGGVVGAQIRVNKAQAAAFDKQAFNNFVNQVQSGWSAKKTADIATLSPNGFNALGVDRVLNWYATKYFDMPNDIFKMPLNYSDYLTDEEMDAEAPTSSSSNSSIGTATDPYNQQY